MHLLLEPFCFFSCSQFRRCLVLHMRPKNGNLSNICVSCYIRSFTDRDEIWHTRVKSAARFLMQNVTTVGSSWRCQVVVTARLDNQDDDLTSPKPFYQHQNQGRRSPSDRVRVSPIVGRGHYHYQGSASGPR